MAAKFVPNPGAFERIHMPGGIIDRAADKAAGKARDYARKEVRANRFDTGALAQSIHSERYRSSRTSVTHRIGSTLHYAVYQHEGTRTPIYPRRAKMLRWTKGGKTIFASKVRGVTPLPFLTNAIRRLSPSDFGR